eukprot:4080611-Pleurochrysis_carterae.AAC.3
MTDQKSASHLPVTRLSSQSSATSYAASPSCFTPLLKLLTQTYPAVSCMIPTAAAHPDDAMLRTGCPPNNLSFRLASYEQPWLAEQRTAIGPGFYGFERNWHGPSGDVPRAWGTDAPHDCYVEGHIQLSFLNMLISAPGIARCDWLDLNH